MAYFFYRLDGRATVHDATCGHCRDGQGQKKANDHRLQSEWAGPFPTYDEASATAKGVGVSLVRPCRACNR